jgi:protoporphyrinogen/coproporphyrinogen III oxidase
MMLRASIGRVGETRDLQRSDDELVVLVRGELRTLLGITAAPIDALVTRWGGGLPQYGIGHLDRIARIRRAVAAVPGLAVCGAAYDGLGIPACIGSAHAAAAQACAAFAQTGQ